MNGDDERRLTALRGAVWGCGPLQEEIHKRIHERRPFVFMGCPDCDQTFLMGMDNCTNLFQLPSAIMEALQVHYQEGHLK